MKKSLAGFCLMACSAFAQETNLPCFVVTESSGTVLAGTVLYPKKMYYQQVPPNTFTNHSYCLRYGTYSKGRPISYVSIGRQGISTNFTTAYDRIYSFSDGTRVYKPRHPTNEVYFCTNDFVRLARTNIVVRPRTAE